MLSEVPLEGDELDTHLTLENTYQGPDPLRNLCYGGQTDNHPACKFGRSSQDTTPPSVTCGGIGKFSRYGVEEEVSSSSSPCNDN